jgi:ribosomal protein S18 acetylase RimI-like enzyme
MQIVRPARWNDHEQLQPIVDDFAALHHKMDPSFRTRWLGFTPAIFQTWLDEPNEVHLVAEVSGKITGYVWAGRGEGNAGIYLFMRRNIFVYVLAVAEPDRNKGVGRALLGAVDDVARDYGAEIIQLSVVAANEGARRFYRTLGYSLTSEVMTKTLARHRRLESDDT